MTNGLELKALKQLVEQLESDYLNYITDFDEKEDNEIDYEDLKKEIFNIQREIKSIVESWEE